MDDGGLAPAGINLVADPRPAADRRRPSADRRGAPSHHPPVRYGCRRGRCVARRHAAGRREVGAPTRPPPPRCRDGPPGRVRDDRCRGRPRGALSRRRGRPRPLPSPHGPVGRWWWSTTHPRIPPPWRRSPPVTVPGWCGVRSTAVRPWPATTVSTTSTPRSSPFSTRMWRLGPAGSTTWWLTSRIPGWSRWLPACGVARRQRSSVATRKNTAPSTWAQEGHRWARAARWPTCPAPPWLPASTR